MVEEDECWSMARTAWTTRSAVRGVVIEDEEQNVNGCDPVMVEERE